MLSTATTFSVQKERKSSALASVLHLSHTSVCHCHRSIRSGQRRYGSFSATANAKSSAEPIRLSQLSPVQRARSSNGMMTTSAPHLPSTSAAVRFSLFSHRSLARPSQLDQGAVLQSDEAARQDGHLLKRAFNSITSRSTSRARPCKRVRDDKTSTPTCAQKRRPTRARICCGSGWTGGPMRVPVSV